MSSAFQNQIGTADFNSLAALAGDIRSQIVDVVSKNGGHLAPSLGVVELAVALHRVFELPRDSIIWDVGHQAYAHKILTGRDLSFQSLRQQGGISGFPKRSENEHDAFGTGHCSTSISAALGIAEAKRMSGEPGKSIAVIGDGALTAGLAYEGLNHAGHVLNKRLIVIFNDNQMSIDKNVGALARFMNKGLINPAYNRIKRDLKTLLKMIAIKDASIIGLSRRAAVVVKDFFLAGSLFEAFGFRYLGPIDGHDIETLVSTLKNISDNIDADDEKSRPVLLHIITKKGKGYKPAEDDPSRFHGTNPFNIEDGKPLSSKRPGVPSYTSVFGTALCDLMKKDSRVVAITAAMPSGTGLDKVKDKFPNRYYDVGIAEPHAAVFAAGLATRGFKPVVAIYSSFLQRSYDAIVHDVCLQNLPVIFAIDRAGVVGEDGPTHHGVFDLSYLRHIPNLALASPRDEDELRNMVFSSVDYDCPIAIRYPRGEAVGVPIGANPRRIPIGKAEVISDPSDANCAIFALGNMVQVAIEAAGLLARRGIKASVINARFVKPIDEDCLFDQALRGRAIFTIEDNVLAGGFGSAVIETFNLKGMTHSSVIRCGYPDEFVEHASISQLHEKYGLVPEALAGRIVEALSLEESGPLLSSAAELQ